MSSQPTVLVLVPNWLGDAVMALPALASLRTHSRVVALGAPPLLALLQDAGLVDAVVAYDRKGVDRGWRGLWKASCAARMHAPAQVFVMPPSLRGAALAALTRAPWRHGFGPAWWRLLLNGRRATPSRSIHATDAWLALVELAPVGAREAMPSLQPGPGGRAGWQALRGRLGLKRDYFVLAPGATYGPTKRWPEASFVGLAQELSEHRSWMPVVVGGRDPEEQKLCARIAESAGGMSVAGETDLPTLASLLAGARAFLGNDSGPMHLAAAVGTPTVGIFGSTSPTWTGPRGPAAVACGPHPVDCAPCFRRRCPIGLPCLNNLHHDNVLRALNRVISEV